VSGEGWEGATGVGIDWNGEMLRVRVEEVNERQLRNPQMPRAHVPEEPDNAGRSLLFGRE
jgi:hypothetical protein